MKRTFLFFLILFSISRFCVAQNRIEILVNGVIQNVTSEAIRVKNSDDKIELRILFESTIKKENLIDSIKVQGCYYSQDQQQQQQQTNSKKASPPNKEKWTTFMKPKFNLNHISFEFSAYQVTFCHGDYFYSYLLFKSGKSIIKTFKGYQSKFKFYLVV